MATCPYQSYLPARVRASLLCVRWGREGTILRFALLPERLTATPSRKTFLLAFLDRITNDDFICETPTR